MRRIENVVVIALLVVVIVGVVSTTQGKLEKAQAGSGDRFTVSKSEALGYDVGVARTICDRQTGQMFLHISNTGSSGISISVTAYPEARCK